MYAGDLTPKQAWEYLLSNPSVELVDVRTDSEWLQDGVPDLSALDRPVHFLSWHAKALEKPSYFIQALQERSFTSATPLLFLCRSGGRSKSAALLASNHGFQKAYNIQGGFLGHLSSFAHEASTPGWKQQGLPWGLHKNG